MIKPMTLAFALTIATTLYSDTDCKVVIREGELIRLAILDEAKIEIIKDSGETELKTLTPKDGSKYAVITLKLAPSKSIGLYDYALVAEKTDVKIETLAMAIEKGDFQRRNWEVRANGNTKVQWVGIYEANDAKKDLRKGSQTVEGNSEIKLLFEVPVSTKRFQLVHKLLDKAVLKEYNPEQILDFDNMSSASPAPSSPSTSEKKEEEKTP